MKKKTVLLVFAAIMLLASAACAETDIEIENYTRYTDYEPQLTEPLGLIQGENHKVLVAWFSRVGNTVFEPDVDVVSSATLQYNSSGELLGNAQMAAGWIAEETGADVFPIDYATDAPYFTILFEDQDASEVYGNQVNIGVITCPLAEIAALNGSYDVLIELDENDEEAESQMQMRINDTPVTVAWENNESVSALRELATNGLTIQMSMYGGFEQVGSIGQRLPSHDVQTTTSSGDIVLYSSSQIVVFYGSNSWAYTRLGRIKDKTPEEVRNLLGNGDVTITLTVE